MHTCKGWCLVLSSIFPFHLCIKLLKNLVRSSRLLPFNFLLFLSNFGPRKINTQLLTCAFCCFSLICLYFWFFYWYCCRKSLYFFTSCFVTFVNILLLFTLWRGDDFQWFECYGKRSECYFFPSPVYKYWKQSTNMANIVLLSTNPPPDIISCSRRHS